MNIVLYQPDIALNVGAIIRLSVCFKAKLHLIEPLGFPYNEKKIRQSALDYFQHAQIIRHSDFDEFLNFKNNNPGKLILFSTKGKKRPYDCQMEINDYLIFGSESKGVKQEVVDNSDEIVKIPISDNARSLNLVTAISVASGEFIRQNNYL
jgi:tRNA (cytidine/uridine-2'-O-)-methyltransferase